MIDGIAARSSIAVPSGRLSQVGESSVRNSAMPKLTGMPMTIAIIELTSVPKIGTSAPNFSWTGSQSLDQTKAMPCLCRLRLLPISSETRIAARMLNTSSAKNRVTFSNSVSFHLSETTGGGEDRWLESLIGREWPLATAEGNAALMRTFLCERFYSQSSRGWQGA